ncbi:MAG TPA: PaaI family thioesterase [Methylomirabilota bacterium]|nr:PaaI family thioesterase [Methylomirabilota bacterium]
MSEQAFQDQGSVNYCYGCGADNEKGLQIKSTWDGEEAVAAWKAQSHHCGGSKEIVNGGIIASLIDCHSLNLAIAHAYRAEGRAIGSAPRIGYVTASLSVSYVRPTPISEPLQLRARITKIEGRKAWVSCTLSAGGQIRATGEVLGIRVERE